MYILTFLKNPVKLKKIWSVGKEVPPAAPLDPLLPRTSNGVNEVIFKRKIPVRYPTYNFTIGQIMVSEWLTRIHSSRMRTGHSSSRPGGPHQAPSREQAPPGTRHPQGPGTPQGPDPPWSRHPPEQAPPWDQAPTQHQTPLTRPPQSRPPVDRHTPLNILPCPKLRLRAVNISQSLTLGWTNQQLADEKSKVNNYCIIIGSSQQTTRKHSSRMRTVRFPTVRALVATRCH